MHKGTLLHDEVFAQVDFFFTIIATPNSYSWSVTLLFLFFNNYFYLICYMCS